MPFSRPSLALGLLAAGLLAACEPTPTASPPASPPAEDSCGAAGLQSFVGQDATVLLATTFATPIRILRPGDVATQDFRPDRANFAVDAAERVTRVYCG